MAYILVRVVPMLTMSHNSLYTFLFFCLRPCFHEPGATSCTEFVCVHTSPGQFYPRRDSFIPGHFRAGIQNFSADDNYAFERNKYRFTLCYFDKYESISSVPAISIFLLSLRRQEHLEHMILSRGICSVRVTRVSVLVPGQLRTTCERRYSGL